MPKNSARRLLIAMIICVPLATVAAFWSHLHISYNTGAPAWFAWEPFNRLQRFLSAPQPPDFAASIASNVGFISTVLLMVMRIKFFWWPFHPAGYAVSSSWSMNVFWSSIFVSWGIKLVILKMGGLKLHRQSIPFFLGLVLGEFVVGSAWSIRKVVFQVPSYQILF